MTWQLLLGKVAHSPARPGVQRPSIAANVVITQIFGMMETESF
jgi:hypothetical protein